MSTALIFAHGLAAGVGLAAMLASAFAPFWPGVALIALGLGLIFWSTT